MNRENLKDRMTSEEVEELVSGGCGEYMSYANNSKCFAMINNGLYLSRGDEGYSLIKSDFM